MSDTVEEYGEVETPPVPTQSDSVGAPQEPVTRRTEIPAIGDLPWGTHFCHFYQNRSDLFDVVIPYFRAGLESNEFCLWITCEPYDPDVARGELRKALPAADSALAAGAIEIVPSRDWYLEEGRFTADRVVAAWSTKLRDAVERGYSGMRVHANEGWLTRSNWRAFADYESSLDDELAGQRLIVLCAYPLEGSSGAEMFDVARTHQFVLARRHGAWEVMEAADSIGAKAELLRLHSDLEERVRTRTRELSEANAALRENVRHLRASEARFRVFVNNASDGIFLLDEVGTILDVNRVACESLGVSREELIGKTIAELQAGMSPADVDRIQEDVATGEVVTFETQYQRKDGAAIPVEVRIRSFSEGGLRFAVSMVRDISARLHLEEQFRQAQKMDALGRLAGGVAHDFNNLLTVINGYSQMMAIDMPADDPNQELVAEIRAAGDRAAMLTRQLLAFSRKEVLNPELVEADLVLKDVSKLLRRLIGEDVELTLALGGGGGIVRVDVGQFEQAVVNLAVNARDAMPGGGILTIATRDVEVSDPDDQTEISKGRYVLVSVSDTGHGMDENTQQHIFEPFFTTKGPGKGTGLGLSMVYGFVQQSAGHIAVESVVGKGSIFKLYLPREAGTPVPSTPQPLTGVAPIGTETILVAEDDDAVRSLCVHVLETHGYKVLAARNGSEALDLANMHRGPIALVLSDTVMPGMGGVELAQALTSVRPAARTLLMSGYTGDVLNVKSLLADGFLQKPFTPIDLARSVRQVLDAPPGGARS